MWYLDDIISYRISNALKKSEILLFSSSQNKVLNVTLRALNVTLRKITCLA